MYQNDYTTSGLNDYWIDQLRTDAATLAQGRAIQAQKKSGEPAPKRRRWFVPQFPVFGRPSTAH